MPEKVRNAALDKASRLLISSERFKDGVELAIDRSSQQVLSRAEVVVDVASVYTSTTGHLAQVKTGQYAFFANYFERRINEFLLCFSSAALSLGYCESTRAAIPATNGEAMDVPCKKRYLPSGTVA